MRKFLNLAIVLLLIFIVTIVTVYNTHPIVFKWLTGTARIIGKPVSAVVYTDGHINNEIQVYKDSCQMSADYLLRLKEFDKYGMLQFIHIDLNDKWVGRPVCSAIDCYDSIEGILFQGQTGSLFVDFKDNMKGYAFDSKLAFRANVIEFNLPPHVLKFNSVRIKLYKQ